MSVSWSSVALNASVSARAFCQLWIDSMLAVRCLASAIMRSASAFSFSIQPLPAPTSPPIAAPQGPAIFAPMKPRLDAFSPMPIALSAVEPCSTNCRAKCMDIPTPSPANDFATSFSERAESSAPFERFRAERLTFSRPSAASFADLAAREFALDGSALGVAGGVGTAGGADAPAPDSAPDTASFTFFFASVLSTSSSTFSFFAIVDLLYFREREYLACG